jgi:hypothetical protein
VSSLLRMPSKIFWRPIWPLAAWSSRCRWRVGRNSMVVTKKLQDSQLTAHLQQLATVRDQARDPRERLGAVLEAYALISYDSRRQHDSELAAFLHRDQHVAQAQRQLHVMISRPTSRGRKDRHCPDRCRARRACALVGVLDTVHAVLFLGGRHRGAGARERLLRRGAQAEKVLQLEVVRPAVGRDGCLPQFPLPFPGHLVGAFHAINAPVAARTPPARRGHRRAPAR